MTNQGAPDLASILATLAQHSGIPARQDANASHTGVPSIRQEVQPLQRQGQVRTQHSALQQAAPPRPSPIDPSRITTWPAALRYTTSLLASHPEIAARIKKLIRSQHEHERAWWTGRQTLLVEREKRKQGRKAVNDVLRALGGRVVDEEGEEMDGAAEAGAGVASDQDVYAEYDGKVYRAAADMVADVRRQLKEMGIPAFVVRSEMLGAGEGRVSREEIRGLEARVLVLLEDLCKD